MKLLTQILFLSLTQFFVISLYAGGVKVKPTYQFIYNKTENKDVPVISALEINHAEAKVEIYRTDSSFWYWGVKGSGFTGVINLTVTEQTGVLWNFNFNGATIVAAIAADYKNVKSPGIISLTTSITNFIYFIENKDTDCNSNFVFYQLPKDHDPDVEFHGDTDMDIASSSPCSAGKWKITASKKLPIDDRIRTAAIFTAMMSMNIRYILDGYELPSK